MAGVKCTKCGAPIEIEVGTKFAKCKYCDSQIFIDKSGVGFFYIIPYQPGFQDVAQASSTFRRWTAGSYMAKDLEALARIRHVKQQYFPVYRFVRDINGQEKVGVEPAKSTTLPGMHNLKVPAGDLKIFDQKYDYGGVTLIPPDIEMNAYLPNLPGKPKEQALVFFPIWNIEYDYKGSVYKTVIDGSTGEVFATDYPPRQALPYVAVAGAGFGVFLVEGMVALFTDIGWWIAGVMGITVVALFAAGYYVASKC